MDPDAALNELFDALADKDYDAAFERADGLVGWLDKGGFMPGGGKLRKSSLEQFLAFVIELTE